jgi:hypothetical protein
LFSISTTPFRWPSIGVASSTTLGHFTPHSYAVKVPSTNTTAATTASSTPTARRNAPSSFSNATTVFVIVDRTAIAATFWPFQNNDEDHMGRRA